MTEQELTAHVGSMDQLARIRTSVLDDGRGVRCVYRLEELYASGG